MSALPANPANSWRTPIVRPPGPYYACPLPQMGLPVVNEEQAIQMCDSYEFFTELIMDMLDEQHMWVANMESCMVTNQHRAFGMEGYRIRGVSLNLHLPALTLIAQQVMFIGFQLQEAPHLQEYFNARQRMVQQVKVEFRRLAEVIPEYTVKAVAEAMVSEVERRSAEEDAEEAR
jgi:hypothetical protein